MIRWIGNVMLSVAAIGCTDHGTHPPAPATMESAPTSQASTQSSAAHGEAMIAEGEKMRAEAREMTASETRDGLSKNDLMMKGDKLILDGKALKDRQ